MHDAVVAVPTPVNEPVLSYAPGSPERARLKAELERQSNDCPEIPIVIGGQRITTGKLVPVSMPHAHRHMVARFHAADAKIDDCTKWWGEDRHIVIYYVKPDRSEIYLVTSQPEPDFRTESWSAKGDVRELRKAFAGFDRQVEQVLAACPDVHKWAIVDRNSLERWGNRNATLLGDACHPMTPYMAQGAAMAIEDAAVLSRCLDGVEREGVANAFRRFEATRKARTERIQQTSRANTWLSGKTDADWVYGYDAWTVPLAA
jgi:salicylate hydroxylase/6-hydroxynicotinate 3-monooxygenase